MARKRQLTDEQRIENRRAQQRALYHRSKKPKPAKVRKQREGVKGRKQVIRDSTMMYRYGITTTDRDNMIAEQKGCCAICLTPFEQSKRGVACVDHCHTTGEVRGMLCDACNKLLGHARDNITILRNAIRYLEIFEE